MSNVKEKIAFLNLEMDEFYLANRLYWDNGKNQTKPETAKYQWRQGLLAKIREDLVALRERSLMGS